MTSYPTRPVPMPATTLMAVLVWTLALVGVPAAAPAQPPGLPWQTSAEAPAGLPPALLAAPDDPAASLSRDAAWDTLAGTPGPAEWRIAGSALKPRENDVSYTVGGSGACTYVTAGDANTVWNAVPDLPDGVVVDVLRMYYSDTSASNTSAWFTVYDLYGSIVNEWSVASSGNAGNSFNDSAAIAHTVDYSRYSYLLNWRPVVTGSTIQLCGFRVFYTTPLLAPGAPQNLTAAANAGTVSITWNPPTSGGPAASYVLEAGSAPGLKNLAVVPVPTTGFSAGGVPSGTYYLRVRAVNATGTGPASAEAILVVP